METREELMERVYAAVDEASDLLQEYDSLPHYYGANILYQAEAKIVDLIAVSPGITVTDLSNLLKKTPSACSQIVRKLRGKGWVEQSRNEENNRQLNLFLTKSGMQIYQDHQEFERECRAISFALLEEFTEEELRTHLRVQKKINEVYMGDVRRSRERFTKR